jgi:hypothetical protein
VYPPGRGSQGATRNRNQYKDPWHSLVKPPSANVLPAPPSARPRRIYILSVYIYICIYILDQFLFLLVIS